MYVTLFKLEFKATISVSLTDTDQAYMDDFLFLVDETNVKLRSDCHASNYSAAGAPRVDHLCTSEWFLLPLRQRDSEDQRLKHCVYLAPGSSKCPLLVLKLLTAATTTCRTATPPPPSESRVFILCFNAPHTVHIFKLLLNAWKQTSVSFSPTILSLTAFSRRHVSCELTGAARPYMLDGAVGMRVFSCDGFWHRRFLSPGCFADSSHVKQETCGANSPLCVSFTELTKDDKIFL